MAWLCSRHTGKDVRFPPTLQFLQLKVKLGKLDFLLGVPVQTAQQETSTTLPRPSLKQVACAMVLSADLPASQASVKFNISISAVHSGSCFDVGRIQSLQDSFEGASPKAIIYFSRMRSGGFPFIVWGSGGCTLVRLQLLVAASSGRRGVVVASLLIPCLCGKLQDLFERFHAGCHVVLRGRRGTL
jgi:hypothetical protein